MPVIIVVLAALALPRPALAQGQEALQAFAAGDYDAALASLAGQENADSEAFAARVLLAEALSCEADPPQDLLQAALREANAALALDPAHVEGRIQKAIALSMIIRPMSAMEANKTGLGEEARNLAKSALESDPDNPYAHGFLAVWNIEVVRRGGSLGAMVMGASVREARKHYEAAAAASPGDASVHWQWARALAALDAKKYRKEIEAALATAEAASPDSDLEGVMQRRASELHAILSSAGPKAAEARALEML
ncbi:MAG: hypothetical protein R3C13_08605 [Hyphomonas sp.]|uniref:hypothetical protein n=1 Tax=Hyphomonas sp. TaxID=87 RepID=UPI0035278D39